MHKSNVSSTKVGLFVVCIDVKAIDRIALKDGRTNVAMQPTEKQLIIRNRTYVLNRLYD